MLITTSIDVKINQTKYYKKLGYDVSFGDIINIDIKDLPLGSDLLVEAKCDICGAINHIKYNKYIKNIGRHGYYSCKGKCAVEKSKLTKKLKYDDENYNNSEQCIKTCIEKYGVENPMSCNIISEKSKNNRNTLNGDFREMTEKIKKTKKEKYGDEFYNNKKLSKKTRTKNICDKNNNVLIKSIDIHNNYKCYCEICKKEFITNKNIAWSRNKYKVIQCTNCNPIGQSSTSFMELQLLDFIKENYDGEIITNDRSIIKPYELDIYLPELKLAFEFNGVYWHNELHKAKDYHLKKTNMCGEIDIHLFHIWEDDWNYKQDIVKSMILNKLQMIDNRIFGRKCIVQEVTDNSIIRKFLNNNHLQGFVGSKIKLGLYYDDELVSLMTFGKLRKIMNSVSTSDSNYELLRFCNKLNTSVIGGASKLFKYFIKNYNVSELISYADRSHSNGNLYTQLGFNKIGETPSNYYYIIDGIRKHRFGFRKDILVKQGYDPNKTEHEIMLERKIYRIYNSGNLKYIFKQKPN